MFTLGHCPNYLTHTPQFGQLFPVVKNDNLRVWQKKIDDDDNDRCHDNFDENFGNFDDTDDKNY